MISCPAQQRDGGCIETALDSNLTRLSLHLPHTATAERHASARVLRPALVSADAHVTELAGDDM